MPPIDTAAINAMVGADLQDPNPEVAFARPAAQAGLTSTELPSDMALINETLVICWLNNARNSLLELAERSRVGHPLKTGEQPCVVESPKNSS
jgi:hypothetical protein